MAIYRILWLSMTVSLAQGCATPGERTGGNPGALGAPEVAVAEPPVNPRTLGRLEGILAFCAKVSGHMPSEDKDRTAPLFGGASEMEVVGARSSTDYKDSYDEVGAELGTVPNDQAKEACRSLAYDK